MNLDLSKKLNIVCLKVLEAVEKCYNSSSNNNFSDESLNNLSMKIGELNDVLKEKHQSSFRILIYPMGEGAQAKIFRGIERKQKRSYGNRIVFFQNNKDNILKEILNEITVLIRIIIEENPNFIQIYEMELKESSFTVLTVEIPVFQRIKFRDLV